MIFGGKVHGNISVKVAGDNGEALLNRLTSAGIPLWNIDTTEDGMIFFAPLAALPLIRRVALTCGCYITVERRYGLPFLWKGVKRRSRSWFTALFVFSLLCLFLSVAWRIELVDASGAALDPALSGEVLAVLDDYDVSPPVWKAKVDTDAVRDAIMARCPSLAWAGLSFHGVTLQISMAERTPAVKETPDCGHVVAAKDGVVRQILALKGQKQVESGATVKKGDILISGDLTYEEEGREPVYDRTAAKGVVTASVWYDGTAYVGLEQVVPEMTGRSAGLVVLSRDDIGCVLWGSGENPFSDFIAEERQISLLGWTLTCHTYREAIPLEQKLDFAAAKARAEKEAGALAQKKMGSQGKIVGREIRELTDVPGAVGVQVILEAEEDIGVFKAAPNR